LLTKKLRITLEAAKVLAEYADGKPGPAVEGVDDTRPLPLDDFPGVPSVRSSQ
jgi:hypothetical protein